MIPRRCAFVVVNVRTDGDNPDRRGRCSARIVEGMPLLAAIAIDGPRPMILQRGTCRGGYSIAVSPSNVPQGAGSCPPKTTTW